MTVDADSILDSTKQLLGIGTDDQSFDVDVLTHINTSFSILDQLGTGPPGGFTVTGSEQLWSDFDPDILPPVKSYVYMTVRLLFDPPPTSFALDAAFKVRDELGWRVNVGAEEVNPPSEPPPLEGETLPGAFAPKVVQMGNVSGDIFMDASLGNVFYLNLTGDSIIFAPSNGLNAQHITMELVSNGHDVVWSTGWDFGSNGEPPLSPDKTDIISAVFHAQFAEWHAGYTLGF
jgi:hypothetical protein